MLVLGDEPMQSAFFHMKTGEVAIARWIYARSRTVAEHHLSNIVGRGLERGSIVKFESAGTTLVIIDAADSGDSPSSCLSHCQISPGMYSISTEEFKCDLEAHFIVHRFILEDRIAGRH